MAAATSVPTYLAANLRAKSANGFFGRVSDRFVGKVHFRRRRGQLDGSLEEIPCLDIGFVCRAYIQCVAGRFDTGVVEVLHLLFRVRTGHVFFAFSIYGIARAHELKNDSARSSPNASHEVRSNRDSIHHGAFLYVVLEEEEGKEEEEEKEG